MRTAFFFLLTCAAAADNSTLVDRVGMLLSELMRIKAEGDYDAIEALVDKYGVRFDPKLRDQVVARYASLNVPIYWCGINSELNAKFDAAGKVTAVTIGHPRDYIKQQLGCAGLCGVQ